MYLKTPKKTDIERNAISLLSEVEYALIVDFYTTIVYNSSAFKATALGILCWALPNATLQCVSYTSLKGIFFIFTSFF
jgi:hypothetical protein